MKRQSIPRATSDMKLEVAIAKGSMPWPLRIAPDMQTQIEKAVDAGEMPEQFKDLQIDMRLDLTQWSDAPLPGRCIRIRAARGRSIGR